MKNISLHDLFSEKDRLIRPSLLTFSFEMKKFNEFYNKEIKTIDNFVNSLFNLSEKTETLNSARIKIAMNSLRGAGNIIIKNNNTLIPETKYKFSIIDHISIPENWLLIVYSGINDYDKMAFIRGNNIYYDNSVLKYAKKVKV